MFYSYVVHDVIEVEPVYLPRPTAAPPPPPPQTSPPSQSPSPKSKPTKAEHDSAAARGNGRPTPGATAVQRLFGTVDDLSGFLAAQEAANARANAAATARHGTKGKAAAAPLPSGDGDGDDDDAYTATLCDALLHRLTEKYVGRVLPGCGLCLAIRDVVEYSKAEVRGASASAWVGVVFEVCVLAPSPGARLRATIRAHDAAGITLSLADFFTGVVPIHLPKEELVAGSLFDDERGQWYLPIEAEAEGGAGAGGGRNYYTLRETVICRVLKCSVKGAAGTDDDAAEGGSSSSGSSSSSGGGEAPAGLMRVTVSFVGDGLGPLSWYEDDAEATDDQ